MNCEDVQPLLNPLSDNALGSQDTALIMAHLKDCHDCLGEWDALLSIRGQMRRLRDHVQPPEDLLSQVKRTIDRESSQKSRDAWRGFINRKLAAMVAALVLLSVSAAYLFWWPNAEATALDVASLVNREFGTDPAFENVADDQLLSQRLGFSIKYLKFKDWKINQAGTVKAKNLKGDEQLIARFQLGRKLPGKVEKIYCYQAPAGSLKTRLLATQKLAGKTVRLGQQGQFSFACWTENDRDYLLVSPFSLKELAELVSSV
jgi:hypothetical protein